MSREDWTDLLTLEELNYKLEKQIKKEKRRLKL